MDGQEAEFVEVFEPFFEEDFWESDGDESDDSDDAVVDPSAANPELAGPACTVTAREGRKSFSREKKLAILKWHRENNATKGQTARKFGLPHHNYVTRWLASEAELKKCPRGTRRLGSERQAQWPELEDRLYEEFKNKRQLGIRVKGWLFRTRAGQLFRELYPDQVNDDDTIPFRVSKHWFERFKERRSVSFACHDQPHPYRTDSKGSACAEVPRRHPQCWGVHLPEHRQHGSNTHALRLEFREDRR